MVVRQARLEDAGAIQAIYAPFVDKTTVTFEEVPPTAAVMEERIRATTVKYPYIVLEDGEAVRGYAYASALRTRAAYQWVAELSIYMSPETVGKGRGRILYAALIDLLKAQGLCTVYGALALPNAASERLHEAMDFREAGLWRRCGFKHGQWLDVKWYEKRIADHDGPPAPIIRFPALDPAAVSDILRHYTEKV